MPGPAFAGVAPVTSFCEWEPTKANPVEGDHRLYGILTMEANRVVGAIRPKAMPVILTTPEELGARGEGGPVGATRHWPGARR
jgi:hypothetical protein